MCPLFQLYSRPLNWAHSWNGERSAKVSWFQGEGLENGVVIVGVFVLLPVCSQRLPLTSASWKDDNHHFCKDLMPIHLHQWKAECRLVGSPGWRFVITRTISYSGTPICSSVSEPASFEKQEWRMTEDLETISASLYVCVWTLGQQWDRELGGCGLGRSSGISQ